MKRTVTLIFLAIFLSSCHSAQDKKGATGNENTICHFHAPTPPSITTDGEERLLWLLDHWWDDCFNQTGRTDSASILGIARPEIEQALVEYIQMLNYVDLKKAQEIEKSWFGKLEKMQEKQAEGSKAFLRYTEMVAKYLYDPNSPYRDEDLFLPFVQGLAASHYTAADMRPGYAYQARMCALNQKGQLVPDFVFKDINGRTHNLFGIKAEYTMLFFSNPGCSACKEIIESLQNRPWLDGFIADKTLAVVNVYIDDEVEEWKSYEHNYPRNWICGYDPNGTIREEQIYDVRAIPSLYLLDKDKKVIMKDAPTEKVLIYMDNIFDNK